MITSFAEDKERPSIKLLVENSGENELDFRRELVQQNLTLGKKIAKGWLPKSLSPKVQMKGPR
jgi:hypothetical protein